MVGRLVKSLSFFFCLYGRKFINSMKYDKFSKNMWKSLIFMCIIELKVRRHRNEGLSAKEDEKLSDAGAGV